jgi:hypothetical protein
VFELLPKTSPQITLITAMCTDPEKILAVETQHRCVSLPGPDKTTSINENCGPQPPSAALQHPVAQTLLPVFACGMYTFAASMICPAWSRYPERRRCARDLLRHTIGSRIPQSLAMLSEARAPALIDADRTD